MNIDFKKNLEEMREKYKKKPIKFKRLPRPIWLWKNDDLYKVYEDKNLIFKYGNVYYASVVQANDSLFKNGIFNYPALVLYSANAQINEDPVILEKIASKIYSYKETPLESVPDDYKEFAKLVRDEMKRKCVDFLTYVNEPENIIAGDFNPAAYAAHCNNSNFEIADIKLRTMMIFRKDLPDKKLRQSIFPVLAAPKICRTAIPLPKEYWSEEFSIYWYY